MQPSPFIFSNAPKYRWRRHLAFWAVWLFSQMFLYSFSPPLMKLDLLHRLEISGTDAVVYLLPHIFLSYTLMYFVIPRFVVKGKYVQTALLMVLLFLATGAISAVESNYILNPVRQLILRDHFNSVPPGFITIGSFFSSLMAGLRGGITIGGLAAAIKLMKYWYVKEQRNLQLKKENAESQLQLLKAQVHPHFLFNTLNNIYAHTQNTAPIASQLVMGLSDMLRYILYECAQPLVPLSKELIMAQNYIGLEKIRYDDQFDIYIDIPENTGNLYIAPLLLLPFVENCFKHGSSRMLEQPWLSLQVHITDDTMNMKLVNGKSTLQEKAGQGQGIGISNVRQRLELLYPGKHELNITDDTDVFIVNLKIGLERKTAERKKEAGVFVLTDHE